MRHVRASVSLASTASMLVAFVMVALVALVQNVDASTTWREVPVGSTWALLAWGWSGGGKDEVANQDVVFIDIDVSSQASLVPSLKSANKTVICYISVGTKEPFRDDVLANATGWASVVVGLMKTWDEQWLDITQLNTLQELMGPRFERAAAAGCDGIEPDNTDCYANTECYMNITAIGGSRAKAIAYQKEYNTWQITYAHSLNLSIGLKNSLELVTSMASSYDFAVNEQCLSESECGRMVYFTGSNKAVFNVEYQLKSNTCSRASAHSMSSKMCAGADGMCVNGTWSDCTTPSPTSPPTLEPTPQPTLQPTPQPTLQTTPQPTLQTTPQPTLQTTPQPTLQTTPQPTLQPTPQPTLQPTPQPTLQPTPQPTLQPTPQPTLQPTPQPTLQPTPQPTLQPTTKKPTLQPTTYPTLVIVPTTSSPTPYPTIMVTTDAIDPSGSLVMSIPTGMRTVNPNTTFANMAWGWADGGKDNATGMDAVMVDLDTTSSEQINMWDEEHKLVVCYFSAGTRELYREDVLADPAAWQAATLNATLETSNAWLNISNLTAMQELLIPRLDRAVAHNCSAIAPDFMDCALQDTCTAFLPNATQALQDQLVFNRWLASAAHERGMLIALQNAPGLVQYLADDFDWAINSNCLSYDECSLYDPFYTRNKSIWVHHYNLDNQTSLCTEAQSLHIQLKFCDGGNNTVNFMCQDGTWHNCFNSLQAGELVAPPINYEARDLVPWANLVVGIPIDTADTSTASSTDSPTTVSETNTTTAANATTSESASNTTNSLRRLVDTRYSHSPHLRALDTIEAVTGDTSIADLDNVTGAEVVLVDLHTQDGQLNSKLVQSLYSNTRAVMCTFSAGVLETWRPDYEENATLWNNLTAFTNTRDWLNISSIDLRILMGKRIVSAANIGCSGILPLDVNCNSYASCRRAFGFSREEADIAQYAYNDWLASMASSQSLKIGLHANSKLADLMVSQYDFAMAEGCISRGECAAYMKFLNTSKPVFNREYSVTTSLCDASEQWGVSTKMCSGDASSQECSNNTTQVNCFGSVGTRGTNESSSDAVEEESDSHSLKLSPVVTGAIGATVGCVLILIYLSYRRRRSSRRRRNSSVDGTVTVFSHNSRHENFRD